MGNKLPPQQMELYKGIDDILYSEWDPIGVASYGLPKDEYQSYLPQVFKIALEGSDPNLIADYLGNITTERMGLDLNASHDLVIAKRIINLKRDVGL